MGIHLLAFPGHKGFTVPLEPVDYILPKAGTDTSQEGGTGSKSEIPDQPDLMPERYESGTINSVGLAVWRRVKIY